jgi:hypothetical protein
MTKCLTLGDAVLNVGEWEYGEIIEVFTAEDYPTEYGKVVDGMWVQNPLPEGAVWEDIPLALTATGKLVKASDPLASTAFRVT